MTQKLNMLLVNPDARSNSDVPNLGLSYIATHLKARVVDFNTLPYPNDRLLRYKAETLGISVQSRTFSEAKRLKEIYKSKYPTAQVKSVTGFLDVQCCYPYLNFAENIECNLIFSDTLPFPNYELLDSFGVFKRHWQLGSWPYAIMTSQGCPYQCIYCVSRMRKWQARSAQNCYAELKRAQETWGITSFSILDDCFNIDTERVVQFCELIAALGLKWSCANGIRADRFDEKIAKAMAGSGCHYISFGIESAAPEVLEAIQKSETIDQIEQAVKIAKQYFKGVNGFFIIGLPNSSYERDLYSLEWSKKMGINAHFSYYVPFDKAIQYDGLFYGDGAYPVSDEYPRELQRKIYVMTEKMRPHIELRVPLAVYLKRKLGNLLQE